MIDLHNWAGNYAYSAARLHVPETVAQVQDVVRRCSKLRALGTKHSFNSIADSAEDLLSTARLNHVVALDRECPTVTVEGGVTYGKLGEYLHREGFALHNMASLPHISVAGACATATHGSGIGNGNLATAVSALEIVTAEGDVQVFSRSQEGERFDGMAVGLGGMGIVTKVSLDIVPTFAVRQDVYEDLSFAELENNFEAIIGSAYSVSLFTDWQEEKFSQVWRKSRVSAYSTAKFEEGREPAWFGARPAKRALHPIAGITAENCTEQMGISGDWHERLPHFRMDYLPSSGEELQSEYFVPREHAVTALRAIMGLRERLAPLLLISEIRMIAADSLWMSPCYRQDCAAIHFTWKLDWPAVEKLLPEIEARLAPFQARPHWGKLFTMPPARLQSLYPKLPEFRQLLLDLDPHGKFRNAFLENYLMRD